MDNSHFLDVIKASFMKYLEYGARSNEKLKILHGAISDDLMVRIKKANTMDDTYSINSLGHGLGQEKKISGRYMDKAIDITINKNGEPAAGIGVKFVMSNYQQNSNNYFENMLGETANIRCADMPYFQILIIPDIMPYFDKENKITKWERVNKYNLEKYIILSQDNVEQYLHTPNKTLIFAIHISGVENLTQATKNGYKEHYTQNPFDVGLSTIELDFARSVIYNNYDKFAQKIVHSILGL